jgi:hypothetical protein
MMQPDNPIYGQLRHLAGIAGTALIAHAVSRGWIGAEWVGTVTEILLGLSTIVGTMGLSWYNARLAKKTITVALAVQPSSSREELTAIVKLPSQ